MAYTFRQAERALKPFENSVFHYTALNQLRWLPDGPEMRMRTQRIRAAFQEYQAELSFCGEL